MKKLIASIVLLIMLLAVGCSEKAGSVAKEPVKLTLLALSAQEKEANIVRDQLKKAGIEVEVKIYPDNGTFVTAAETGKYDMGIRGYSGCGSPDANVRGPFHSQGVWNISQYNDPEVDELIDLAASQTGDVALDTYKRLEQALVVDKAYTTPLYNGKKTYAVNHNVVDTGSIETSVGGARWLWSTDYVDKSLRDTRPYNMGISWPNPNNFDCIQGRDGSTYYQRTNINVPLIQCVMGGEIITRGSLTRTYAIAEGNLDLYFLLRTDINFGTVKNGQAVDTGMLVAAEDVKFTYDRAIENITPNAVGASYLSFVDEVNIVSDIEMLKTPMTSGSDKSIFESLNDGLEKPFMALASGRADVNAGSGKYQVVHIKLKEPYPQQLVTLAASQVSIVPKEIIEKVNAGITKDNYDPTKHVLYGDPTTLTKGSDHGMYFSGQYVLLYVDDYGSYLQRNPGFAPGSDDAAFIKNVNMLAIADNATQTAALRNGEVDEAAPSGENIKLCEQDDNITVVKTPSVSVTSIYCFLFGESKMLDENLRKAVFSAINMDEVIAVMGPDMYVPTGSNLCMLDTGFVPKQDLKKSAEYLEAYRKSLGK
jgi:peptide/nickel transport system substrate-binding protein